MPRQAMTARHLPARHGNHVADQLTSLAPGLVSPANQKDLGVVLPEPLPALATGETTPTRKPSESWTRARLEPTIRAANDQTRIDDLDLEPLHLVNQAPRSRGMRPDEDEQTYDRAPSGPFLCRRR